MEERAKEDALELIRTHLPKYLTPELKDDLFSAVKKNFPLSIDSDLLYQNLKDINIYYQGDGIIDIPFSIFNSANGKFDSTYLSGVIISNTCDILSENKRIEKPIIQFSSIFSLDEYLISLRKSGISEDKILGFIDNLKKNRISSLFYLPKKEIEGKIVIEESFIKFDSNVSLPSTVLEGSSYNKNYKPNGDRIFSFSNYGFYLFLIKLSIHYCRFREGVFRVA